MYKPAIIGTSHSLKRAIRAIPPKITRAVKIATPIAVTCGSRFTISKALANVLACTEL